MSLRRVRPAEWLAGAAGIALLASLFVPWYDAAQVAAGFTGWTAYAPLAAALTGWQAFAVLDVVLALLALSGPALLGAQAASRAPGLPLGLTIVAVTAGAVATVVVVVRILVRPDGYGLAAGAWIGLVAALALLAGAWWALGTERSPGAPVPHVELRPAPPPA